MRKENFFTGEAINNASPPLSEEQIAADMASFGASGYASQNPYQQYAQPGLEYNPYTQQVENINQARFNNPYYNAYVQHEQAMQQAPQQNYQFVYDPNLGLENQQQMQYNYNPNMYGYNYNQQNIPNQGYNPNVGYNYNQQIQVGMQGYNYQNQGMQNLNPQQGVQSFNPQFGGQNRYNQQPVQQQKIFHVPPLNFGGEFMPSVGWEEKIDRIESDLWFKIQQETVDRKFSNLNGPGFANMGPNFYGNAYFGYGMTQAEQEAIQAVKEMEAEARQNKIDFNIRISKIAHHFLKDGVTDQQIEETYTGRDILVDETIYDPVFENELNRMNNLVPIDTTAKYRRHFLAVQAEHNSIVPADANMQEGLEAMGMLAMNYALEEERARRRNCGEDYDQNVYKHIVRSKAMKRHQEKHGMSLMDDYDIYGRPIRHKTNDYGNAGFANRASTIETVNPNETAGFANLAAMMNSDYFTEEEKKRNLAAIENVKDRLKNGEDIDTDKLKVELLKTFMGPSANIADDGTLILSPPTGMDSGESIHNSQESEYDYDRQRFGQFMDSVPGGVGTIYMSTHDMPVAPTS